VHNFLFVQSKIFLKTNLHLFHQLLRVILHQIPKESKIYIKAKTLQRQWQSYWLWQWRHVESVCQSWNLRSRPYILNTDDFSYSTGYRSGWKLNCHCVNVILSSQSKLTWPAAPTTIAVFMGAAEEATTPLGEIYPMCVWVSEPRWKCVHWEWCVWDGGRGCRRDRTVLPTACGLVSNVPEVLTHCSHTQTHGCLHTDGCVHS